MQTTEDIDAATRAALGMVAESTRDIRFYGFDEDYDVRTVVFRVSVDGADIYVVATEPFVDPAGFYMG